MKQELARRIDSLLQREIDVHQRYVKVLDQERASIGRVPAEELAKLTTQREELCELMKICSHDRETLVREVLNVPRPAHRRVPVAPIPTLREFIKKECLPADAKRLVAKVEQLRAIAALAHEKSKECNQVVDFSLRMVSGLASLLRSATQHVVQSYSPQGKMVEQTHSGTYARKSPRLA